MDKKESRLVIRRDYIENNVRAVRQLTGARLMAVVKEDGYGIGIASAYRILSGCGVDFFCVGTPREALTLRNLGFSGDILLLTPEYSLPLCSQLLEENIIFMVGNSRQADVLRQASRGMRRSPRIHIKIDTGLGRYGFFRDTLLTVKFCTLDMNIEGIYTHFASCGRNYRKNILLQKQRFDQALKILEESGVPVPFVHAAASRTLAWAGDLGYDGVRIGSLLLGKETEGRADFQDAVRLEAKICEKKWYPAGEYAGYQRDVKLKRDSLIGVVRAGCGDGLGLARQSRERLGLLRHAVRNMFFPDHAYCLSGNGSRVPILDNTGTGHTLVDLTGLGLNPGDVLSFRINPLLADPDIPKIIVGDGEGIKDAASF